MSVVSFAGLLPEFGTLTPGTAVRWVAALLAEANVLREYDAFLYPTAPAQQHTAERLHEAWRAWLDEAQTLLQQAEPLSSNGGTIPDLDVLYESIARTRAVLRLSPSLILHRYEQMQRGEVYPLEEVRRELRAGNRG